MTTRDSRKCLTQSAISSAALLALLHGTAEPNRVGMNFRPALRGTEYSKICPYGFSGLQEYSKAETYIEVSLDADERLVWISTHEQELGTDMGVIEISIDPSQVACGEEEVRKGESVPLETFATRILGSHSPFA